MKQPKGHVMHTDQSATLQPRKGFTMIDNSWRGDDRLSSADTVVLFVLASYADAAGICFPSIKTVADDANLSVRHTHRCVSNLVSHGYLMKIRQGQQGRSNRYVVVPKRNAHKNTAQGVTPRSPTHDTSVRGGMTPMSSEQDQGTRPRNSISPLFGDEPVKDDLEAEFERDFWPLTRIKGGKAPAKVKYVTRRKEGTPKQVICDGWQRYNDETRTRDDQFVMQASRWLNEKRWTDPPGTHRRTPADSNGSGSAMARTASRREHLASFMAETLESDEAGAGDQGRGRGPGGAVDITPGAVASQAGADPDRQDRSLVAGAIREAPGRDS